MAGKRSPLAHWHESHGARLLESHGIEVPYRFSTSEAEYESLRTAAGLIDRCHDSRFRLTGEAAGEVLDFLTTSVLSGLEPNQTRQSYMCNERGGIIDSVAIHRTDKFYLLHGTGSMSERLLGWMQSQTADKAIEIANNTKTQGTIEVRGPLAHGILESALLDGSLPHRPGESTIVQIGQARCLIFNAPFAGIEGYQINMGTPFLEDVWDRLYSMGAQLGLVPVGQQAVDILTLEAGIPQVGTEIDEDTTPIELGEAEDIAFHKRRFVGRRALLHSTCGEFSRRLVNIRFEDGRMPRGGDRVMYDGMPVGRITRAARSPRLGMGIALAFVDALKAARGTQLQIAAQEHTLVGEVIDSAIRESR